MGSSRDRFYHYKSASEDSGAQKTRRASLLQIERGAPFEPRMLYRQLAMPKEQIRDWVVSPFWLGSNLFYSEQKNYRAKVFDIHL